MNWRSVLWIVACLGIIVAVLIRCLMPAVQDPPATFQTVITSDVAGPGQEATGKGGFGLLFAIGVLDSAPRMGFLLFLPFLLKAKGASLTTVGLALSLVFIGGAFGKAACGWLGARLGLLATVVATEVGTTVAILTVLALPLAPGLALLPLLGYAQRHVVSALRRSARSCNAGTNRTSLRSVLYGQTAETLPVNGRCVESPGCATVNVASGILRCVRMP
jgi:predicted MFS family arabinose efflux permease